MKARFVKKLFIFLKEFLYLILYMNWYEALIISEFIIHVFCCRPTSHTRKTTRFRHGSNSHKASPSVGIIWLWFRFSVPYPILFGARQKASVLWLSGRIPVSAGEQIFAANQIAYVNSTSLAKNKFGKINTICKLICYSPTGTIVTRLRIWRTSDMELVSLWRAALSPAMKLATLLAALGRTPPKHILRPVSTSQTFLCRYKITVNMFSAQCILLYTTKLMHKKKHILSSWWISWMKVPLYTCICIYVRTCLFWIRQ